MTVSLLSIILIAVSAFGKTIEISYSYKLEPIVWAIMLNNAYFSMGLSDFSCSKEGTAGTSPQSEDISKKGARVKITSLPFSTSKPLTICQTIS